MQQLRCFVGRALSLGLAVAFALAAPGCRAAVVGAAGTETLFHGGTIWVDTAGPEGQLAHALLTREGRVVALDAEALELAGRAGKRVQRYDLRGNVAVPGLHDAHGHVLNLGTLLEQLDLRAARSFEELIAAVEQRANELPAGAWVLGRGWDQTRWPGGAFPQHAELSRRVPDHPVLLQRVDGHAALANERALATVGWSGRLESEPVVAGGRVLLDDAGYATGVLVDAAADWLDKQVPAPGAPELRARLLAAQAEILRSGLTTVHEMSADVAWLPVLEELCREGSWKLGLRLYLWGNDGLADDVLAAYPAVLDPERRVRVVGVKLSVDGALGSRGAALLDDYHDEPGQRGLLTLAPERFREYLQRAAENGLQPAVHAIGDRANRMVLDAFEDLAERVDLSLLRPRLEHAQVLALADLPRVRALDVVPSVQPTHATSDMRWAAQRLGPERVQGAYAWGALDPELDRLAFGSDFPVEAVSPLLGLYAARTRQDAAGEPLGGFGPEHRLDGLAALRGFTAGAARAAREAEERGSLLPGYACDLTVLDIDPVTCLPSALLTGRTVATVVAGELVYEAE